MGQFRQEFGVDKDNDFASLITPIKQRMFETVWRLLRHSQDAEDALQNVWGTRHQSCRSGFI